ncbi:hypothetical protein HPP92_024805 [Vanilla planifolia]|uniref:Endonuclease/exonuclease/phosphatase domain-containing protein n=1 Tax=Vanilla planifolia TaxID=51239 RepID=A0A835UBV3_VANPL|nr:hypothetical protein HPP92_024805 [Vanilla planifolia]
MASVASRLGGRALLLSSPVDPRQRARRSRRGFSGAWHSVEPRDRRWYNPERHRQPNPVRRWVEAETCFDLPDCRDDRFVLISHNILGVNNILEYSSLYMRIPSDSLQWESRKRLICDDLRGWDADIFCLQALDRYYDVESFLRKDGYAGSYKVMPRMDVLSFGKRKDFLCLRLVPLNLLVMVFVITWLNSLFLR